MLAGCETVTTNSAYLYKDIPSTKAQKAKAILDCEIYAAKEVPVSNQTSTTPRWTTPVYTTPVSCYGGYGGYTSCYGGQTSGGQTFGGNTVTRDANSGLREQVLDQCLANKDYRKTSFPIPICLTEQIPQGYANSSTLVLKPVHGSCVIDGGRFGGSVILLPKDQLKPNKA